MFSGITRKFYAGRPVSVRTASGLRPVGAVVRLEGRHRPTGPVVVVRTAAGEAKLHYTRAVVGGAE